MPISKLKLLPGVDLQSTPTLNVARWAQSQLVRFYEGLLQKLGGWTRLNSTPCIGTCRSMVAWADLAGVPYIATGTEQRLQVIINGSPVDITPILATTNHAVNFSTTSGAKPVVIVDTQVPAVGDWINLITQVSVGGLIMAGLYQVTAVGSGNYTINATANAGSTVANGGAVATFATTGIGSPNVRVVFANHGLTAITSSFNVPVSVTVGGVTLSGLYEVQTVIDVNTFTIFASAAATSVAGPVGMNSGNAQIQYLLPTGYAVNTPVSGYGEGNYGVGNYGVSVGTSATSHMRVWALDHYGKDLIASPNGGQLYFWDPQGNIPATVPASNPPLNNNWVLSVPSVQMVMSLGAEDGGTQYPLLLKWCDVAGLFATNGWVPTPYNQAGSFQLNSGSRLVFGAANNQTIYVWTDLGVWSATYQGLPFVFSVAEIARECGAISSRAVAITAVGATWLSAQGFFQLGGGGVQPMECPVWDWYYTNVDITQLDAITSALNTAFHEISWYFPVIGGGMYYVKWNWVEQAWDYGILVRTAWIDASPAGGPLGVDQNGLIQQHEVGVDADGAAMISFAQSGYFDAHEGEDYVFCDMLIPDFRTSNGAVLNLTILQQNYPEANSRPDGPYSMQFFPGSGSSALPSAYVVTNSRGRQLAIRIQSHDVGSSWRLGALRYKWKPDGMI